MYVPKRKENFKVNFFFSVLDATINAIQDRFEQLECYVNKFHFLQSFNSACKMSKDEIIKHCKHLKNALSGPTSEGFSKDIIGIDLANELELFKTFMPEKQTPQEILSFICDLNTLLPNLLR